MSVYVQHRKIDKKSLVTAHIWKDCMDSDPGYYNRDNTITGVSFKHVSLSGAILAVAHFISQAKGEYGIPQTTCIIYT